MRNLGVAQIAWIIITFISDQVKNNIAENIALENAAAEYNYFRELNYKDLTDLAMELSKRFPIYTYQRWFYLLQSLQEYGLMQKPRTPGEIIKLPQTLIATPSGDKGNGKGEGEGNGKDKTTQYILYAVIGAIILYIALD